MVNILTLVKSSSILITAEKLNVKFYKSLCFGSFLFLKRCKFCILGKKHNISFKANGKSPIFFE